MATNLKFPPRRLGASEDWGRSLEDQLNKISRAADLANQTLGNLERQAVSQGDLAAKQIQGLWNTSLLIQSQNVLLAERISTAHTESSVGVNAFGPQFTVTKPEWSHGAIIIVGLEAVSNPGTGWLARIDIYSETHPITSSSISENRVVAQGAMGFEPGAPVDPPDHLGFESLPGVRFFDDEDETLYLRPYGLQVGGGSTSVIHRFNLSTTILWV